MPPERRLEAKSPTELVTPPPTDVTESVEGSAQEQLQPGTVLESRFRIIRMLGRGGMGAVYDAVDLALGTRIAVKTVRLEQGSNDARLQRFRREIRSVDDVGKTASGQFQTLLDANTDTEQPWFATEYLPSKTLQ